MKLTIIQTIPAQPGLLFYVDWDDGLRFEATTTGDWYTCVPGGVTTTVEPVTASIATIGAQARGQRLPAR